MVNKYIYITPDGFSNLILSFEDNDLVKIEFDFEDSLIGSYENCSNDITNWLDDYFKGNMPNNMPKYKLNGLTEFQNEVLEIVKSIPYGKTISYNEIAKIIAYKRGIKKMSAQAVGHAVGLNPLPIIIPCHRVIGSNNKIGGYHGGVNNKIFLLKLEKIIS